LFAVKNVDIVIFHSALSIAEMELISWCSIKQLRLDRIFFANLKNGTRLKAQGARKKHKERRTAQGTK
jgi:hypothetical protein